MRARDGLPVFAFPAQQSAITATHQGLPGLDQANRAIAEIMSLPTAFGNAAPPKQTRRYGAVAISFKAAIKCPYCEYELLASLKR
jgi:hypothetical protein